MSMTQKIATDLPTWTGGSFDPFAPRIEDLRLEDIARGLANTCRYGGQCQFYSVAQHSFEMAEQALKLHEIEVARWCLFHDAAEVYLFDVRRPTKVGLGWSIEGREFIPFEQVECCILHLIAAKFDLAMPIPPLVWELDNRSLATERRDLFPKQSVYQWPHYLHCDRPFEETIYPCSPAFAEQFFLQKYETLFGE